MLAQHLAIECDVVVSCKLYAPERRERTVGAVSEQGEIYLSSEGREHLTDDRIYVDSQVVEVQRRLKLFRVVRPAREHRGPVGGDR